jgi:hypothetical protein
MKEPTAEMIKAGNDMASEMIDACLSKDFGKLGGGDDDMTKFSEIALRYVNEDGFDSVTGIYMAMEAAKNIEENDNGLL